MWLSGLGFGETFGHHASKSADSAWLASSRCIKVGAPLTKNTPKPLGSDVLGVVSSLTWTRGGVWVNQLDFG